MISETVCRQVLTIGNECYPPKGGLAQVINTYGEYLFRPFKFISFYNGGNSLYKVYCFVIGLVKTLFILLFDRNIRIVHIHTGSRTSFKRASFFIKLSHCLRKKVVIHMHGGGFKEYYHHHSAFVNRVLKETDAIIALTNNWKEFYNSIGFSKVFVVPNIIEPPLVRHIERTTIAQFLFLGQICDNKGIFDLLKVIGDNHETLVSKMVLHIGGNGEVSRLVETIRELGIEDLVVFEGWVQGDAKKRLLNLCDCYILPSYIEGLPISILEALSYGEYVISTNVGGIPEIIDSICGVLITPGDKKELLSSMLSVIDNIQSIRISQSKRSKKLETNLPESVACVLETLYQSLLS